ncbi:MAG: HlyD family efflux transporter periplasmic adaptor subunit [Thermodesulfobacteria bacterium]|nr:HlyD family efflux transporter periplasmic adaptor subunit [Thermodesulfobacteriota bacterium]
MAKSKIITAFIIILLVMAGAYFYYQKEEGQKKEGQLTIYGNIDIRQVQLAFYGEGRIKDLLVDEGASVHAGELLGQLDDSRLRASVEKLEADVAAQQQVVNRMHAGSRPQEIKAAKARVQKAKAALTDARITYNRLKKLSKTKFISRQQLDDARARLDMAIAALKEAQELYSLVMEGPRKEDVLAAEARLDALEKALELARQKLKDAKLYAPSDGIIRDRVLQPGDMAFPERPVFTLALTNPLWVRAYIPEPDLGKIALGMKAKIQVDSFPDEEFQGWVGYISPTAEFTPRNVETPDLRTRLVYQVRVYVCNPQNKLRLGMPATVTIDTKGPKHKGPYRPSEICQQEDTRP